MRTLLMSILVVGFGGADGVGQDVEKPPVETAPAEKIMLGEPIVPSPPQTLSSLKQAGLTYDQTAASEILLPDLTISTNVPLQTVPTNTLTTIELERLEIRGTVTPAIKKRTLGSVLQLFNPFAPAEYGGTDPSDGQAGFSRAFHDPVKDGPSTVLFGIDRKSKKTSTDSGE